MDGVSAKGAAFAVAASLAAQILGSVAIAIVGPRLPAVPGLVAMCIANLLVIALIGAFHGGAVFVPASLLFGFIWNAEMPLLFRCCSGPIPLDVWRCCPRARNCWAARPDLYSPP